MYLGVDIGGTKTLVAVFDDKGKLKVSEKFPTPADYPAFLKQLDEIVAKLATKPLKAACVAAPGTIDHATGVVLGFGNLNWTNVPLLADCKRIFKCPTVIDNDAKLAGLSEAKLIRKDFKRVLYVTVSTGIGLGLTTNGVIDHTIADAGGHAFLLEHNGQLVPWESFASGRAIVERYGKRASELDDPTAWQAIAHDLAKGLITLIVTLQPDVIVFGGGVGAHFKKFEKPLKRVLKSYETPMLPIPPLRQAKHAEEAVIYGCYDLLKDLYGTRSR